MDSQMIRFMLMDKLIRKGKTGPANQFSKKLGCSVSTFNVNLRDLRQYLNPIGVDVTYSTSAKSYIYTRLGEFNIILSWTNFENPSKSAIIFDKNDKRIKEKK